MKQLEVRRTNTDIFNKFNAVTSEYQNEFQFFKIKN